MKKLILLLTVLALSGNLSYGKNRGGGGLKTGFGNAEPSVRTDSNCGVGNVCSGSWTPSFVHVTPAATTNFTHFGSKFSRVGNVVHFWTVFNYDTNTTGNMTIDFSIPIGANFTAAIEAAGMVYADSLSSIANNGQRCRAQTGTSNIRCIFNMGDTATHELRVFGYYEVQ